MSTNNLVFEVENRDRECLYKGPYDQAKMIELAMNEDLIRFKCTYPEKTVSSSLFPGKIKENKEQNVSDLIIRYKSNCDKGAERIVRALHDYKDYNEAILCFFIITLVQELNKHKDNKNLHNLIEELNRRFLDNLNDCSEEEKEFLNDLAVAASDTVKAVEYQHSLPQKDSELKKNKDRYLVLTGLFDEYNDTFFTGTSELDGKIDYHLGVPAEEFVNMREIFEGTIKVSFVKSVETAKKAEQVYQNK